jgi:hypothetical protein
MSLLDKLKERLAKAKEAGALPVEDADAIVGLAEGIDDEIMLRLFKAILLVTPPNTALAIYHGLIALDPVIAEEWEEKLYLDELKAAAKQAI